MDYLNSLNIIIISDQNQEYRIDLIFNLYDSLLGPYTFLIDIPISDI
jgi:hypothetical protein